MSAVKWTQIGLDRGYKCCIVLGPLLFTIFIEGIYEEVLCDVYKFANDIKIASLVNTLNDIR